MFFPLVSFSQIFCNTSFEEKTKNSFPKYWQLHPASAESIISVDSKVSFRGKYSMRIDNRANEKNDTFSYILNTVNTSTIPSVKKIVVTVWAKTNALNDSSAFLLLNDDSKFIFSRCFIKKHFKGKSSNWQKLAITKEFDEPQKIWQIYIAGCMKGNGNAWFDNFSINIDGKNIAQNAAIRFTENDKKWLIKHSIKETEKYSESFLDQISRIAGNKYLLGIGEPTHGTHEAYSFKIEMFKYLVQHYQYRNIALENGMAESYMIDRYIKGEYLPQYSMSRQEYRKYLNDFLYTNEVIDFIEWMRLYNKLHNDKISFVGMDIQTYEQCISNLKELLREMNLPNLTDYVSAIDTGIYKLTVQKLDEVVMRQAILKQLDTLSDSCRFKLLYKNEQESNISWLFQHIELLRSFLLEDEARWNNFSKRTQFMCNNLLWYLKNKNLEKTLIWTHNGHINKKEGPQNIFQREGSLGNFLKLSFGNDYYCVGIYTANGTYSACINEENKIWKTFHLDKPNRRTIEYYFALATSSIFFLDLSKSLPAELPAIFNQNILQRTNGMFYSQDQFYDIGSASELYDGIYFIPTSTSTNRVKKLDF